MRVIYMAICYLVYYAGLAWVIKLLVARRKVSIILYHDPSAQIFERHVEYLTRNYNLISLSEYLEARKKKKKLPPYSLIITFDDGHRGNFELLPCIQKNNISPTIYICTSIVDTYRKFWFRIGGLISKRIKGLSNEARLKYLNEMFGFFPEQSYNQDQRQALTKQEINEMKALVDFQSHTCFHPILTTCSAEEAKKEIVDSANTLSKEYGNRDLHFAFPNGDYTEREIEILKSAGYLSARTTDVGWNDLHSDVFKLKITGVSDHSSLPVFKAELSGLPGYLYNIFISGLNMKTIKGMHQPESEKN